MTKEDAIKRGHAKTPRGRSPVLHDKRTEGGGRAQKHYMKEGPKPYYFESSDSEMDRYKCPQQERKRSRGRTPSFGGGHKNVPSEHREEQKVEMLMRGGGRDGGPVREGVSDVVGSRAPYRSERDCFFPDMQKGKDMRGKSPTGHRTI